MSDLQRYPINLYLSINDNEIVIFVKKRDKFSYFPSLFQSIKLQVTFVEKQRLKIINFKQKK